MSCIFPVGFYESQRYWIYKKPHAHQYRSLAMSQILTFNYERKFFLFRQICNENIVSMFSSRTNLIQRFIRDAFCLFINGYRGCYRDFACLRRIFYYVSLQRKLAKGETFRDSRRNVNVEFAQWNSLNGIRFFYSHVRARARAHTRAHTFR